MSNCLAEPAQSAFQAIDPGPELPRPSRPLIQKEEEMEIPKNMPPL